MIITVDVHGRYVIRDERGSILAVRAEWFDAVAFIAARLRWA